MSVPEENFDSLRKLLALKRHEQPPPGYFERLPGKITARIELEDLTEFSSWWQWLVNTFDAKPVVACVYGVAVSGLLLFGFKFSEQYEREMTTDSTLANGWLAATPGSGSIFSVDSDRLSALDASALGFASGGVPTGSDEPDSLLWSGGSLRVQRVGFASDPR